MSLNLSDHLDWDVQDNSHDIYRRINGAFSAAIKANGNAERSRLEESGRTVCLWTRVLRRPRWWVVGSGAWSLGFDETRQAFLPTCRRFWEANFDQLGEIISCNH